MGRRINICFAGDSGVGKSSIVNRIEKGEFSLIVSATVGYPHYFDKKTIQEIETTVCLIDTGGQDKYRAMAPSYFRDADGIFLIFSLEKDESIRGLQLWMQAIDQVVSNTVPKILIANKADLVEEPSPAAKIFINRLEKQNYKVYLASAKSGQNINEAYQYLIQASFNYLKSQWSQRKSQIKLSSSSISKKERKCSC